MLSNPPVTYKDMQPIVNVLFDAPVFYVRADSPFKDLKDIMAYAKENPGKLKFGAGSAASSEVATSYATSPRLTRPCRRSPFISRTYHGSPRHHHAAELTLARTWHLRTARRIRLPYSCAMPR